MHARYAIAAVLLLIGAGRPCAATASEPDAAGARTLKAITIEGAVDVPQVLFITSRDNARFDDGLARWYLSTIAEPQRDGVLPLVLRPYPFPSDDTTDGGGIPVSPALPEAKE